MFLYRGVKIKRHLRLEVPLLGQLWRIIAGVSCVSTIFTPRLAIRGNTNRQRQMDRRLHYHIVRS